MSRRGGCPHLSTITNIPIGALVESRETKSCDDCDSIGPNLWICLHQKCLKFGCSDQFNDHSTLHYKSFPNHCICMNLSTQRIWCYGCKKEVFMEALDTGNESDPETYTHKSIDSGNASFSTNKTTSPVGGGNSAAYPLERRQVGLNVGNGGDTSDSSECEDEDEDDSLPAGLVGLQNIGNTCYMNSALQALSNAGPLTNFFLDCGIVVNELVYGKKPGLSLTYHDLMNDIWIKKNGGYVVPSGILYGMRSVHPMFRGYHQHDTQEFLRNFMDQLHEELKQPVAPQGTSLCGASTLEPSMDAFAMAMEEPPTSPLSSSYDSSEGEYETCDSGVSERSSLSDDTESRVGKSVGNNSKRRLSRSASPGRRLRARLQSASNVIDSQPCTNTGTIPMNTKKQIKYRSIISDIFDGKLLSSVQCLTCNRVSSRIETFQDLSLPIPTKDHLMVLHGRVVSQGATCTDAVIPIQDGWLTWILSWFKSWFYGPTVTLHDCLAAFFSTDELKGDNMYSCEKCNKLRNGIKFSKVLQLPEILCIHLKRFRHELMFSSKISFAVSFPLKGLEMKPYLHKECVSKVTNYELFSVICHHGTAGGGHYISYALNNNQWYEFDDQYVTKVGTEKVEQCEAYVLFYRKKSDYGEDVRRKAHRMCEQFAEFEQECAFVSKQWISRFNTCTEPGPIDNSDFLCHHGQINPERELIFKQLTIVLPLNVYTFLQQKYGGCPPITMFNVCPSCTALNDRLLREMEIFEQLNIEAQNEELPLTHLMSNSWCMRWHNFVQKKTMEAPGPIDNSKINPSDIDRNECAEITADLWNFFYSIYGGGPELRIPQTQEEVENETMEPENDLLEMYGFELPKKKEPSNHCHGEPIEINDVVNGGVVEKKGDGNFSKSKSNKCTCRKNKDNSDSCRKHSNVASCHN